MPNLRFILTEDGYTAHYRLGKVHTSDQMQPRARREQVLRVAGVHALLLHDSGLQLGLKRARYDVHMEVLGQLRGPAHEPYTGVAGAQPWQRPGWYKETLAWLEGHLGERITGIEQVNTYDLACVLRLELADRAVFLKATEIVYESAVTAYLAEIHSGLTPRVRLAAPDRGLLLTENGGKRLSEHTDLAVWKGAVQRLAQFHRTASASSLQALGCSVHDFSTLGERAAHFLQDTDTLHRWGPSGQHLQDLSALATPCQEAYERLYALGLPLFAPSRRRPPHERPCEL